MNSLLTKMKAGVWLSMMMCTSVLVAGERIVVENVGFATPESVEYYAAEDVYLVTNINGSPFAADDNGFISKIRPDGTVIDIKWIDGASKDVTLHAPKGAAIMGNNLYVADRNQVHVFALPSGKQKASITIKESTFLNGITPGEGGSLYVTDSGLKEGFASSGTDAVYQVWASGRYKLIIRDKEMNRPNGILVQGKDLIVVSFGGNSVLRIDSSGKKHVKYNAPKGGLDGLLKLDDGRFLISSWGAGSIYEVSKDGSFGILADKLDAPADMGFDSKRNRVLVPLFKQDKIVLLSM